MALVAAAAAGGCALITGVGDLDPSLPDGIDPGADSSSTSSSGSSGSNGEGGGTDATVDAFEASTLLKGITFENGKLVDPQTGGDLSMGDAGLLTKDANIDESGDATALTAIGGN